MIVKVNTYNSKNELIRIFITELKGYLFDAYEEGFTLNNIGLHWTKDDAKENNHYYIIEAFKNCLEGNEKTIKVIVNSNSVEIADNWSDDE